MVSKKSRPRRSAEETRRVLVEQGMRHIESVGLDFGFDHLTLEQACVEANVPRSSSHAAWAIHDDFAPQALYQRSVLEAWLAARKNRTFAEAVNAELQRAFERHGDVLTQDDVLRIAGQAALEADVHEHEDHTSTGVLAADVAIRHTLASQPVERRDPDIAQWVASSEANNRAARIADIYRPLAELLQIEPRPEYGDDAFDHLAVSIAAVREGIVMRASVASDPSVVRRSIRNGDTRGIPATLMGVCVEALVDKFFQPRSEADRVRFS